MAHSTKQFADAENVVRSASKGTPTAALIARSVLAEQKRCADIARSEMGICMEMGASSETINVCRRIVERIVAELVDKSKPRRTTPLSYGLATMKD